MRPTRKARKYMNALFVASRPKSLNEYSGGTILLYCHILLRQLHIPATVRDGGSHAEEDSIWSGGY